MVRRSVRRLGTMPENDEDRTFPAQKNDAYQNTGPTSQLDVCRCPKCNGPMTARFGKSVPYFHCLCYEITKEAQSVLPMAEPVRTESPGVVPVSA